MAIMEATRLNKQSEMILAYLRAYGSISPAEALKECACMRLAARIHDLKAAGIRIKCDIERTPNRFGEPCRVARYSLEQAPVQGSMF